MVPLAAVTVNTADDPVLALLVQLATPLGITWLAVAVFVGRWLLSNDRLKRAWTWVKAAFGVVTAVSKLEPTLVAIRADQAEQRDAMSKHLQDAALDRQTLTSGLHEANARLDVVLALGREVKHEVRNNGGSSLKDSAHRIEKALGLPDPAAYPETGPTPITTPRP